MSSLEELQYNLSSISERLQSYNMLGIDNDIRLCRTGFEGYWSSSEDDNIKALRRGTRADPDRG